MNKSRFIEQLNLFLDEELSPAEGEELMAAVRSNPEYLSIYRQYCQIQKACESFDFGDAAAPKAGRLSFKQIAYAFSGVAAAGALLFMAAQNAKPFFQNADAPPMLAKAEQPSIFTPQADRFEVLAPSSSSSEFERTLQSAPQFVSLGGMSLERSLSGDPMFATATSNRGRIAPEKARVAQAQMEAFLKEQRSKLENLFGGVGNFETVASTSPALRLDSNPAVFSYSRTRLSEQGSKK